MTNPTEQARAIVAEWKQDVRNGVPVDPDDMLAALIAQALQAARDEERERCAKLVGTGLNAEGNLSLNADLGENTRQTHSHCAYVLRQLLDAIRAQAPSPADSLPPSEPSLPPSPDPSEYARGVPDEYWTDRANLAAQDAYERGVRDAAELANRYGDNHQTWRGYELSIRILALLPKGPASECSEDCQSHNGGGCTCGNLAKRLAGKAPKGDSGVSGG